MANSPRLELKQIQKQIQKLSQVQITALHYLSMGNETLREEIYREASNNPAIEIVKENYSDLESSASYSPNRNPAWSRDSYSSSYGNSTAKRVIHDRIQ